MKDRPFQIFYDADEGGASGGDASTSTVDVFGGDETGTTPEPTVTPEPVEAKEVTPTPALTPEQITAAVREGVTPAPQAKEYTQEELDKLFKVWNPSEEIVTKLLAGGQEAVNALVLMREGLAGQFGQLVKYELEVLKKQLTEQYSPALTVAQEIKAEREKTAFFKDYPDLKDHENVVDIAYKSLLGERKTFPTLKEAQKALADRAKTLIPNGNGSGIVQPNGARKQETTTKPKPAQLSAGGQAGGSGGGSATPNVFHDVFGPQ